MNRVKVIFVLFVVFAMGLPGHAQFNTASPTYLTTTAAATSEESPYTVTKDIAKKSENDNLPVVNSYLLFQENDKDFAIFEYKQGKRRAYQIIAVTNSFSILCEHYAEEQCDCFEGLHIFDTTMEKPLRVRRLFPFSLKVNLIDEINLRSETLITAEDFNGVCEILESLD